jgi:hypothetical protein
MLRLPGFTRFLQVSHQVYAALRSSSPPEMHSYAQKWPSDTGFQPGQERAGKCMNLKEKNFCELRELLSALS